MISRCNGTVNVNLEQKDILLTIKDGKFQMIDVNDRNHKITIEYNEKSLRDTIDILSALYYTRYYKSRFTKELEKTKSILMKRQELEEGNNGDHSKH